MALQVGPEITVLSRRPVSDSKVAAIIDAFLIGGNLEQKSTDIKFQLEHIRDGLLGKHVGGTSPLEMETTATKQDIVEALRDVENETDTETKKKKDKKKKKKKRDSIIDKSVAFHEKIKEEALKMDETEGEEDQGRAPDDGNKKKIKKQKKKRKKTEQDNGVKEEEGRGEGNDVNSSTREHKKSKKKKKKKRSDDDN
mmetsp:Transcript_34520/g.56974  ORF Transcript_34520/g.56974 Transcript_34520/m.56974 type:complete len:197 (+) Transcript_34520:29-619(+)|eukprot:CAMPEP_0194716322 /NCGR_PEP_ID=MMETSP0296-20130528/8050_1 /TAXON_ID=39354 /ORGANISM="Heterosigma akashiwo, Strain CCMP2393" /LENGTH=196 /DNA_ID=CAMNT_0039616661 /DNA_START=28 /DNA_END=618 /DNA_ORIENTATION=-